MVYGLFKLILISNPELKVYLWDFANTGISYLPLSPPTTFVNSSWIGEICLWLGKIFWWVCWGTYVVTFQLLEMKPSLHQNLPLGNWQYLGVGRTHDGIRHIQSTTSGRISPTRKSAQGMFTANGIFFWKIYLYWKRHNVWKWFLWLFQKASYISLRRQWFRLVVPMLMLMVLSLILK